MAYSFLKKDTKENLIAITSGFTLKMDFLKNLKCLTWLLKITPVEKSFVNKVDKLNIEKKSCLKLVDILKIFWKKYSSLLAMYFEFDDIK
jgi:hypothetical protein